MPVGGAATARRALAIASAMLTCTGTTVTVPSVPGVEVAGSNALTHSPLVVMSWGDGYDHGQRNCAPTFTLYEDGLVIYHRVEGDRLVPTQGNLGSAAATALLHELVGYGLLREPAFQYVLQAIDQPQTTILLRVGATWHRREVLGLGRYGEVNDPSEEGAPPAFTATMRRLMSFEAINAEPWHAEQIEITLRSASIYPPGPVRPWPADVPAPRIEGSTTDLDYLLDRASEDAARRGFASDVFYSLAGASWRVHVWGGAVPEQQYIAKVDRQLRNAKFDP
jgi:hypothetical protein